MASPTLPDNPVPQSPYLPEAWRPFVKSPESPAVTAEQLDLVKKTVAQGATEAELKLYLYDCARQGVHPLDRLLHFTKRGGRYTPITSIDLMRIRASETGEYAGNHDPIFIFSDDGRPECATVTVERLAQGIRCSFTATARWSEYYPGDGAVGMMWRKMPHTMLGKCAEALALRKGFPRQLAGLYAREEMDQAGSDKGNGGYTVEVPNVPAPTSKMPDGALEAVEREARIQRVDTDVRDGCYRIQQVKPGFGKSRGELTVWKSGASDLEHYPIFQDRVKAIAEQASQDGMDVRLEIVTSQTSGKPYVKNVHVITDEQEPPEPFEESSF